MRRPLSNTGGPTRSGGEPELAAALEQALAAADGDDMTALTHGFHPYPARMHAKLAGAVLDHFEGVRVLDPFCGSGTVLVEAMVRGRQARGVDLNPVATRVAAIKCERRDEEDRKRFAAALTAVAEASTARVKARTHAMAPLSDEQRAAYEPHVLKELAGLLEEIRAVEPAADRRALEMVLSAMVVKFSRRRSDTSTDVADKKIGKGVPTSFFARKGSELVARWTELDRACAAVEGDIHRPRIVQGDATKLGQTLPPNWRADVVLTSPPYGGTYDYAEHHELRYPWLGLDASKLERGELGARRHLQGADAAARWDGQVAAVLSAIAAALAPEGRAILYVGDAQLAGRRIDARLQLEQHAPAAGLRVLAWAAQSRRDWTGGEARGETLVVLAPT